VISRRVPMLIRPAIDDTDPIRYRRPTPDGQFSGNIIDEAMRPSTLGRSMAWLADRRRDPAPINTIKRDLDEVTDGEVKSRPLGSVSVRKARRKRRSFCFS
jgi:hypothetical protein